LSLFLLNKACHINSILQYHHTQLNTKTETENMQNIYIHYHEEIILVNDRQCLHSLYTWYNTNIGSWFTERV